MYHNNHYYDYNKSSDSVPNEPIISDITRTFDNFAMTLNEGRQTVRRDRFLTIAERVIIDTIDNCLKNWYKLWIDTYLADGREFERVFELMEELLYHEDQIRRSLTCLEQDKLDKYAKIVAVLIDYGNAILNIDMIVRSNDKTTEELDPDSMTTIELFLAHVYSHNRREQLLRFYERDRTSSFDLMGPTLMGDQGDLRNNDESYLLKQVPSTFSIYSNDLQSNQANYLTTNQERPTRTSLPNPRVYITGGNILRSVSSARPSPAGSLDHISSASLSVQSEKDLVEKQIEVDLLISTMKSEAFQENPATRASILPSVLEKINSFMTKSHNPDKLSYCFELLRVLLNTVEKFPKQSRADDVASIARELLEPIVKKIYVIDSSVEFQHAYWTTFLVSIFKLIDYDDFVNYLRNSSPAKTAAFFGDYLFFVRQFMSSTSSVDDSRKSATSQNSDQTINLRRPYPSHWIEMTLMACKTFLTSLTYLHKVIEKVFHANRRLYSSFIDCIMHFLLQETLRSDRHMSKTKHRATANELVNKLTTLLEQAWNSISDQNVKEELIEEIMEPLLNVLMVLKPKEREKLGPMIHDMTLCNYLKQYKYCAPSIAIGRNRIPSTASFSPISLESTQQTVQCSNSDGYIPHSMAVDRFQTPHLRSNDTDKNTVKSNSSSNILREASIKSYDGTVLTDFTHLIIYKLNTLMIDKELGDATFCDDLRDFIAGEPEERYYNNILSISDYEDFKELAAHTSDLVEEFTQICLNYREANKLNYRHCYLLCTFKLVQFFRDKVEKNELYLTYLYKLFCSHYTAGRYVEAAYTLLEHSNSLKSSESPLDTSYRALISRLFQLQSPITDQTSLKVLLYELAMSYFEQGELWEAAIPLCQELSDLYCNKIFKYDRLALILQRMSLYFNNIVTQSKSRKISNYFRVSFYGNGFPKMIRNATMIYRGNPFENLNDFKATIRQKYPDAIEYKSMDKPPEAELNKPEAKYMVINNCKPIVDLSGRFPDLSKVDDAVLAYYKNNECDKFYFDQNVSNPNDRTSNKKIDPDDVGNLWVKRTILETSALPGVLPFFQVFCDEENWKRIIINPIENAIEKMEAKNDELVSMINRFKADKNKTEDPRQFELLLTGMITPFVNGGISKYEDAFFVSEPKPSSYLLLPNAEYSNIFDGLASNVQSKQTDDQQSPLSAPQRKLSNVYPEKLVDKLKSLIAKQVPLLDEALKLHRDRVADVSMRQHEQLEEAYKDLKAHIIMKYRRYLPQEYSKSMKSLRGSRSPTRHRQLSTSGPFQTTTLESRGGTANNPSAGSISPSWETTSLNTGPRPKRTSLSSINVSGPLKGENSSASIPYRQLTDDQSPTKPIETPLIELSSNSESSRPELALPVVYVESKKSGDSKMESSAMSGALSGSLPVLSQDGMSELSAIFRQEKSSKEQERSLYDLL